MNTERRLLAYLKPYARALIGGLLCAAVTSAITVGIFRFIQEAIDSMTNGDASRLKFMCSGVIGVFMVKGLFSYGQSYLLSLTANSVASRMRDEIFAHIHSMSLSFFNRRRTGAIMSVLTNDVPVIQTAAMRLKDVVSAPLTIVISLIALFRVNWQLTLVSLIFIPFMAVAISRIGKYLRRNSALVQDKLSDVTTIIEETVAGARIIKSFAAEKHEIDRFQGENANTLKFVMKGVRRNSQLRPVIEFIGAFGVALVLFLGGNKVALTNLGQEQHIAAWQKAHPNVDVPKRIRDWIPDGGMTAGKLIGFLYLLDTLSRAAGDIGGIISMHAAALAAAKRIFDEVLNVETEVKEKPDAIEMPTLVGTISFENVSFSYSPNSPPVLKNISFVVKPGEVVALVGKTGAGKSTVVDLIPRFYDPTEGRILVDGVDIRDMKLETLRNQIGIVPQETWLFAGTLRDNIAYGNRTATDEEVKSAAYAANASFIEGMEKKLETVVGERGIRLSGGEKQRIAIARAILMNPRLLILDEATSSLDASSEALVQEALQELMKGRTTVVIAHRLSTIINSDRILAMHEGRIVEMGSHRELIAAGGHYARLYETQLRGFE